MAKQTNLILFGVDSLWADPMSGYGYSRLTTPPIAPSRTFRKLCDGGEG
ncbi:MAG: hypothetical protein KY468_06625 [Armatimonadetes bacterium]|nr:hypothetical protein [Armatimonadota bacterium]